MPIRFVVVVFADKMLVKWLSGVFIMAHRINGGQMDGLLVRFVDSSRVAALLVAPNMRN